MALSSVCQLTDVSCCVLASLLYRRASVCFHSQCLLASGLTLCACVTPRELAQGHTLP